MNREICGQCGQSLDPDWVDERIPKLESMLREAIRERDSLRQHLHDEHQRHVGTMDERDAALADLAAARAERDLWRKRALGVAPPPRFANVSCSQCGREFGPGDHGYSHCKDHSDAALAGEKK